MSAARIGVLGLVTVFAGLSHGARRDHFDLRAAPAPPADVPSPYRVTGFALETISGATFGPRRADCGLPSVAIRDPGAVLQLPAPADSVFVILCAGGTNPVIQAYDATGKLIAQAHTPPEPPTPQKVSLSGKAIERLVILPAGSKELVLVAVDTWGP